MGCASYCSSSDSDTSRSPTSSSASLCRRQSVPSSCHENQSFHSSEPSGSTMRAWKEPSTRTVSTWAVTHAAGASSLTATSTSIISPSRSHCQSSGGCAEPSAFSSSAFSSSAASSTSSSTSSSAACCRCGARPLAAPPRVLDAPLDSRAPSRAPSKNAATAAAPLDGRAPSRAPSRAMVGISGSGSVPRLRRRHPL